MTTPQTNILDQIVASKKRMLSARDWMSIKKLEASPLYERKCESLTKRLSVPGIIAEFKRCSPSKGILNNSANVVDVVQDYERYGAAGISILTDQEFFGGSNEDLINVRELVDCPLLRKDFIVDEYQVVESKSLGADVILLIAACLSKKEVRKLSALAQALGMEVLLEVHDEHELDHICEFTALVGVNNRDLKSFSVNIDRSLALANRIPDDRIKIAESGIDSTRTIELFFDHGFKGFLIGEYFMKQPDPGKAFADFRNELPW